MGTRSNVFSGAGASAARPSLESVSGQAGFEVAARHGDGRYELHFNDREFGTRRVFVNWGRWVASFALRSAAELAVGDLFPELGYGLLLRNKDLAMGAWDMREVDGGGIGFVVSYTALIAGLDGNALRIICEALCKEAAAVDKGLRSKGLI